MSDPIRHQLAIARRRAMFLPEPVRREESWAMLLTLADCARSGRRISVSGVCLSSGVPDTTALRHFKLLVAEGLVRRTPDPEDGRRHWVNITDDGLAAVQRVLAVPAEQPPSPAYRCTTNGRAVGL